jgi:hypothetical protein
MNKSKKAVLIALVSTAFLLGCGDENNPEEELPTPTSKEVNCLLANGQCTKMKSATCLDLGGQSVEQCSTDESINCRLATGECSKMEVVTCLELGGKKVEQCTEPPGGGNSSSGTEVETSSSSGGSKNETITGDGALCSIGGKRAICQWDTGCYFVDSGWDKKPCTELIASCLENGKLFTATSLSEPDANMHKEKNGFQCANIGGTEFEGNLPGVSSPSGGKSSSSGGTVVDKSSSSSDGEDIIIDIDFCTLDNGKQVFCQWATGCFELSSTFDPGKRTCSAIISECFAAGQVFTGVDTSNLTEDNEYGKGLQCANIGGVTANGITGDEEGGHCKLNGKVFFCDYAPYLGNPGACFAHSSEYNPENGNCQAQYDNCIENEGTIYFNVNQSLLTAANGYGSGLRCSTSGGTLTLY